MRTLVFLFFITMFLMTQLACGQSDCAGLVRGIVQNENAEILTGAAVLMKNGKGVTTNEKGEFKIENLCLGKHQIRVQYLGYKTATINFALPDATFLRITLAPDVTDLEEVVIKDDLVNAEHNQNLSQLSQQQLAETSGKTLGESLKELAGVSSIQAGPAIFKPVIHGVHSQRILILNHGIRQEGQQWGAEHAPEIDPFIASSIAVVKDASAIKYGSDALGGVVIVNPAELPENSTLGGTAQTILQSNGRAATFSGMLEGGFKNREGWGWRVQGTTKQAGDHRAPNYNLTNTGVRELNFSAGLGVHRKRYGIEAYFSHFRSTLGILRGTAISNLDDLVVAMESEVPQYTEAFSYVIREPRQFVNHSLLKLSGHIKTAKGEVRVQYGFQNNKRQEFDIRRGALSSLPAIDLILNTHTLEVEREQFWDNASWCMGITGMLQNNNNIPGTQRIPFIPNFVGTSAGAFVISKFHVGHVTFDFGARYDLRHYQVSGFDFKNTLYRSRLLFNNVSATAGMVIKLNHQQRFTSNLSSAWRPPHVAELYSLGTHQSAAAIEYGLLLNEQTNEVMNINNASFQVEQALKWVNTYNYESNGWQLEATGFANYIFNYIYLKPGGITQNVRGVYPYFRYTQTDALFVGADVTVGYALTSQLQLGAKASMLHATDVKQDDFLVFIPSNRGETSLRYSVEKLRGVTHAFAEAKLKYVAHQNRAPQTITVREIKSAGEQNIDLFQDGKNFDFADAPDGYWLVNFSVGFAIPSGQSRFDVRLACENTLNTSYREYTNRFRYYADELGQNFIFSLKYSF